MHNFNLKTFSISLLILIIMLMVVNCSGSDPSRFYNLTSIHNKEISELSERNKDISISIGTFKLPDYLNRQQIITRKTKNELNVAEYDRWAEPLQINMKRIIVENLSSLLKTDNIYLIAVSDSNLVNYQISIEIISFEMYPDSALQMQARWHISLDEKTNLLLSQNSYFTENVMGNGYNNLVATMSKCVGLLCKDIASEINKRMMEF